MRDRSIDAGRRRALAIMGATLYAVALTSSLAWLWLLRLPG
jgi:hypothetical protein